MKSIFARGTAAGKEKQNNVKPTLQLQLRVMANYQSAKLVTGPGNNKKANMACLMPTF